MQLMEVGIHTVNMTPGFAVIAFGIAAVSFKRNFIAGAGVIAEDWLTIGLAFVVWNILGTPIRRRLVKIQLILSMSSGTCLTSRGNHFSLFRLDI